MLIMMNTYYEWKLFKKIQEKIPLQVKEHLIEQFNNHDVKSLAAIRSKRAVVKKSFQPSQKKCRD